MRVTFPRLADHSRGYVVIERDDGVVYRMDGFTRVSAKLPHDLRHLIVERELRVSDGIFGAIAAGTVWTSMEHLRGRRAPPPAGRSEQLKRAQRDRAGRAELLANLVEAVAALDNPSPEAVRQVTRRKLSAVPLAEPGADPAEVMELPPPEALIAAASALQVETARWTRLKVGDELVYEWPPPPPEARVSEARVSEARAPEARALHAVPRPRDGGTPRRQPHRK
jgi:hypothetical protein